jgi:hypothetical protein
VDSTQFSIVFVHGLQGDPEKTWTHVSSPTLRKRSFRFMQKTKVEVSQAAVFWPLHLLPNHPELASVRILTWGYDSRVSNFFSANNRQNISRHGNDLMVALEQVRKGNVRAYSSRFWCRANKLFSHQGLLYSLLIVWEGFSLRLYVIKSAL